MTKQTDRFEAALAALLGPLAKAMIAYGVTIRTANESMKKALLKAASETSDTDLSDSRASLMTGIHRKDIKRLRNLDTDSTLRQSANVAALVIGHWATDPDFQGQTGAPLNLPRSGTESAPGFDDVVRKARVDMAPGTVLRALLDQEIVTPLKDGTYRLMTHAFVPKAGSAEQVAAYEATLSAHLMAATHNLLSKDGEDRHFDRAVRFTHLSEASVKTLTEFADRKAQELLQEINAMARDMQNADQGGETGGKFIAGAYTLPTRPEPKND
jgi:hypothetical protein